MSELPKALEGPERLIGSAVLDFVLDAVLGAGGMSVVYRGRHRMTGQEVAIKILPPELAVHDELKARFVEEARVLARLEHPNIVQLNNLTEQGGRLCLVMQFVEGSTFEQRVLAPGGLSNDEIVRVSIEVLKALEYAHDNDVVHRDIKPSNILIRPDGVVKVTDFGIAKIIGQSRLTSTGQTMGTVRYMSPEQVRGKQVDARTDLYSLGVTMYEALTGRTPFDGENQFDIMRQHLTERPPALVPVGEPIPEALETIVMRALEKAPDDRFADAATFRLALESLRAPTGTVRPGRRAPTLTSPRLKRRRRLILAAILTTAAGLGGGVFYASRRAPETNRREEWPEPYRLERLTFATDRTFMQEKLRVLSVAQRDAEAVRNRVLDTRARLEAFLARNPSAPAAARGAVGRAGPLNLAIVPDKAMGQPDLWPGISFVPDVLYASRYVAPKRTLFLSETAVDDVREIAYGVAQHCLAAARLTHQEMTSLAESFASSLVVRRR